MLRRITQFKVCSILVCSIIFLFCIQEFSFSLPEVQEVVSGTAQISQPNSTTLQINADNNAIINYSSFNISENESVVINLPSTNAQILNKVLGNSASQLLGNLNSNGLFVLVNPSGIYIGPKATIDAASIIMSTRDISNADFVNGNYLFQKLTSEQLDKLLLNEGTITTQEGGFGVLIAGGIENKGKIIASAGKVALAAGDAVTLDISKDGLISVAVGKETSSSVVDSQGNAVTDQIKNTGTLEANGGTIILDAESASGIFKQGVNLQGYVTANKLENKDGVLRIVSDRNVSINATVKATNIEVGGSTGKIPENVEVAGGSMDAENNITILAKKNITINADLTAQGIIHLEAQKIIDLTSAIKANTLKLTGQEFSVNTNAVNLEVYKTLNDFVINSSSVLNGLITIQGPQINLIYPLSSNITIKSDGPIQTTGTAIISAQKVSLLSNKFGNYETPVRISADEILIHRLSGTIEIAKSTDQGGNISIRGPPTDNFSIQYPSTASLTLKTTNGAITLASGVTLSANNLTLQAVNKIDLTGNIIAKTINLLSDSDITSRGTLQAIRTTSDTGIIKIVSKSGLIEIAGEIIASSQVSSISGGNITIQGEYILLTGSIYANGNNNASGGNINIEATKNTLLSKGSLVQSRGIGQNSNGGNIRLWSDQRSMMLPGSKLDVRGGEISGNGGFAEFSSKDSFYFKGDVDATATNGTMGTFLLDPSSITITNGAGAGTLDDELPTILSSVADDGGNTVSEAALEALNANISLASTGNITINDLTDNLLNLANLNTESFTLSAYGNITFNDTSDEIRTAGGAINLTADADNSGAGTLTLGKLTSNNGDITLRGADISLNNTISVGSGSIAVYTSVPTIQMGLGNSPGGGSFLLTDTEFDFLSTTNYIYLGQDGSQSGNIHVGALTNSVSIIQTTFSTTGTITFNGALNLLNSTAILIESNDVSIPSGGSITSTGSVTFFTRAVGGSGETTMGIGDSPGGGVWTLTDAELDRITAGTDIQFGQRNGMQDENIFVGALSYGVNSVPLLFSTGGTLSINGALSTTNAGIELTAGAVAIDTTNGSVNSGSGNIYLDATGALNIGDNLSGGYHLTDAEFDKLSSSGTIYVGTAANGGYRTGDIAIGDLTPSTTTTLDFYTDGGTVTSTGNFTLNGTLTISTGGSNNRLTISAGTLDANNKTVTINGNFTLSGGTFNTGTGVITFGDAAADTVTISSGTLNIQSDATNTDIVKTAGTWTNSGGTIVYKAGSAVTTNLLSALSSYNNLEINSSGSTYNLDGNITVNGTLTLTAGTYGANSRTTTVTGLATLNAGTYSASTATQTFNGGLTISGGTFTGAAGTVAVNGTLTMSSGTLTAPSGTFTVSGNWNVTGGTFTEGTSTVSLSGATSTITTSAASNPQFYNLTTAASQTTTLASNVRVSNTFTAGSGSTLTATGALRTLQAGFSTGSGNFNIGDATGDVGFIQDNGGATPDFSFQGAGSTITIGHTSNGGSYLQNNSPGSMTWVTNLTLNGTGSYFYFSTGDNANDNYLSGNLTVNDGAYLLNNTSGGTWAPLQIDGNLIVSGSTHTGWDTTNTNLTFTGSSGSTLTLGSSFPIKNLNLSKNASGTTVTLGAALDVDNVLTLTTGTLDTSASSYAIAVGGNWVNSSANGIFTPNSGTVTFDASSGTQTLTSGGTGSGKTFYNLTHSGAGTLQLTTNALNVGGTFINSAGTFDADTNDLAVTVTGLATVSGGTFTASSSATATFNGGLTISGGTFTGAAGTVDVNGTLTMYSGTLTAPSGTFTVSGDWNVTGGTFTPGSNTVTLDGTSATLKITSTSTSFNRLSLNGSGTWTLQDALDVNSNLTLTTAAGTLDVSTNNYSINVAGNWANLGSSTFTARSGRVTFDGTSAQNLNGGGTGSTKAFYNVTVSNTSGDIDMITSATKIDGTLTINSSASFDLNDQNLTLATLDNNGTLKLQGGQTVTITTMDTDSGTVQYTGTSSYTGFAAGNNYYSLSIGGAGTWTLNANLDVNLNLTLTTAAGTLDVSTNNYSINVAGNWANLGSSTFTARSGRVTFDGTSAQNLNGGGTGDNKDFYNITISNTSADVDVITSALEIDGTLTINTGASFDLIDQNLTLATLSNSGTFYLKGAQTVSITTMDTDSGTVQYTGTSSYAGLAAGNSYYNLTIATSGTWTLNANLDINGAFVMSLTAGTLDVSATNYSITIAGAWSNLGSSVFNARNGTVTFDGTSQQSLNSGGTGDNKDFYNITISNTSADVDVITSALEIDGTLTINTGASFDLIDQNLTLAALSNSGTLNLKGAQTVSITTMDTDSGTVQYTGTSSYTGLAAGNNYYNLTIATSGTWTLNAALTVNGSLTITSGTLDVSASSYSINIAGNWVNNGTFTPGTGTVTFDGGTGVTQTLNSGGTSSGKTFYNLTHSGAGTVELAQAIDIDNNFTNSSGTWDTNGKNMTVGGNWTNSATFTPRIGTVTFDGTGTSTISGSTTFYNLTSATAGKQLNFEAGATQSVTNILTLTGASGNLIKLRSTSDGTQWKINPIGTRSVTYVDVKDSYNIALVGINVTDGTSLDSGNNTGWNFPGTTATSDNLNQSTKILSLLKKLALKKLAAKAKYIAHMKDRLTRQFNALRAHIASLQSIAHADEISDLPNLWSTLNPYDVFGTDRFRLFNTQISLFEGSVYAKCYKDAGQECSAEIILKPGDIVSVKWEKDPVLVEKQNKNFEKNIKNYLPRKNQNYPIADSSAHDPRYAILKTIEGQVEIRQKDGDWQEAEAGMILYETDEMRTGKSSYAELLIDKQGAAGRLEIQEVTRLGINTLTLNEKTNEKTTLLDVAIGRVMIHVEKLKGDSKFEIRTPTSTMGVRGTVFEVVVEDGEGS